MAHPLAEILPTTAREVIGLRIQRLAKQDAEGPARRETLAWAAAAGRRFDAEVLADAIGEGAPHLSARLDAHLDALLEAGLLRECPCLSGDVLEFDDKGARKAGKVNVGRVCIDSGSRTDVVEDVIIKDRRHISEDGIVLPIIAINKLSGRVESTPEIVTRGFAVGDNGLMDGARQVVMQTLEQSSEEEKGDYGVIKEKIRADLKRYISKQTQKRPLIMPVILEI